MKKFRIIFIILSLLIVTATSAAATTVYSTWTQTSSGMGDTSTPPGYPDTTSFAFSPNFVSDHTVYAGTYNGVFKSIDSGSTWTLLPSSGLDIGQVKSLAISPKYTSDHSLAAGTASGVFLSADNGASWTDISNGLPYKSIEVVVFNPSYNYPSSRDLFVGTTGNGVYKNTSNSWNWQAMNNGLCEQRVLTLAFTPGYALDSNGYLFAGVDGSGGGECGGIFKIMKGDPNTLWVDQNTGLKTILAVHMVVDALAISPNFASDHTIFAGIKSSQGIYRSDTGGDSWSLVEGTTSFDIQSLAISPFYPCDRTIFAGGERDGVYVSRDKGATWNMMNSGGFTGGKDILSIVVAPGKSSPALNLFAGANGDGAWQFIIPHACIYIPLLKK